MTYIYVHIYCDTGSTGIRYHTTHTHTGCMVAYIGAFFTVIPSKRSFGALGVGAERRHFSSKAHFQLLQFQIEPGYDDKAVVVEGEILLLLRSVGIISEGS